MAVTLAQAAPMADLKQQPRSDLQVREPYSGKIETAQGWPIPVAMEKLFGPKWKEISEWVFVCQDGYRAVIPTKRLTEHHGMLATAWKGREEFSVLKDVAGKKVLTPVGPFYLVWENLHDAEMAKEGDHGWPYQIVDIESSEPVEKPWVPDSKASMRVRKGYATCQSFCLSCHSIDGKGGKVGPELHAPINVTQYYNPAYLPKWILDPLSIRKGTPMPAYRPEAPLDDRKREVDEIIAYLNWLAGEQRKVAHP